MLLANGADPNRNFGSPSRALITVSRKDACAADFFKLMMDAGVDINVDFSKINDYSSAFMKGWEKRTLQPCVEMAKIMKTRIGDDASSAISPFRFAIALNSVVFMDLLDR